MARKKSKPNKAVYSAPTSTTINDLPNEILTDILKRSYSSLEDIAKTRTTNKHFKAATNDTFKPLTGINLTKGNTAKFTKLAQKSLNKKLRTGDKVHQLLFGEKQPDNLRRHQTNVVRREASQLARSMHSNIRVLDLQVPPR